jgi:hypothetical protein
VRALPPPFAAEAAERRQFIDVPMSAFDVVEHRTLTVTWGYGAIHDPAWTRR